MTRSIGGPILIGIALLAITFGTRERWKFPVPMFFLTAFFLVVALTFKTTQYRSYTNQPLIDFFKVVLITFVGVTVLDTRARRVLLDGEDVVLANREFDLLQFLMERPGQVVSRDELVTEVWGSADLRSSKTLDMHVSWLRRKIGDDRADRPRHIVTVRGMGFRFDA